MSDAEIGPLLARLDAQQKTIDILGARQDMLDCSHRFCRGVNRLDRDILRSAFHADAIDDHGFFLGGVEELLAWIASLYANIRTTQHYVTNQTVELDGDVAHAEQYWFVANVIEDGAKVMLRGGRYVDRFEKRDGRWAIAERACLIEWNIGSEAANFDADSTAILAETGTIARDRSDLSYQRPLRVRRPAPQG